MRVDVVNTHPRRTVEASGIPIAAHVARRLLSWLVVQRLPQHPRTAALDSRATFWLLVTTIGSLFGFFLVFGPLGWVFGGRLRREYGAIGSRPRAAATATWLLGILITVSGVATILFMVWLMAAMAFHW